MLEGLPFAVADPVVRLAPVAQEQEVPARTAVDRAAAPEVGVNRVVAGAARDRVRTVARVDEVLAGTAVEAVVLADRLAAGLEVAPDDVAVPMAPDHVVAVAAEQLVASRGALDDPAPVVRVALVDDRVRPTFVARVAVDERSRGEGRYEQHSDRDRWESAHVCLLEREDSPCIPPALDLDLERTATAGGRVQMGGRGARSCESVCPQALACTSMRRPTSEPSASSATSSTASRRRQRTAIRLPFRSSTIRLPSLVHISAS